MAAVRSRRQGASDFPTDARTHTSCCSGLERDLGGVRDVLQHLLHERACGVGIARRVVLGLGDVDGLDDAVVDEHREALAPRVAEHRHRARVVEAQAQRLGELTAWVAEEGDHGAFDVLVRGPGLHDGAVVDAVCEDISDALGLQLSLLLQVARNLACGSCGRKSSRQSNQNHPLALHLLGEAELLGREAEVQGHVREQVSGLHLRGRADRRHGEGCCGHEALARKPAQN
mmetsp:Transcript_117433/g.332744  ORF Transcript_117433/g.332744 Transcript_117433/m.332744 type:complete len:230 (+) Transcript_117433:478-1167(+)